MSVLLSALFVNNIVLVYFFGLENLGENTKNSSNAFAVVVNVLFLMVFSSVSGYLIYDYILRPYELEMLLLMVGIVNIVFMSGVVTWFLKKFMKVVYEETKDFLVPAIVSSVILGVSLANIEKADDIYFYVYANFCNALGFALVVVVMTNINDRMRGVKLPKGMSGVPLLMLVLGMISMAFMGFGGI